MPSQLEQAAGPPTSLALLRQHVDEVREAVGRLLDHTQVVYDDINARADGVVFIGWMPHRWGPPKDGAQTHFGETRQTWQSLQDLISQAVRRSAPERTQPVQSTDGLLRNIIEQSDTWQGAAGESVEQIRQRVDSSLQELVALLEQLPAAHGPGGRVLVPDTNALLFKPDLETWRPPGGAWTVVLVPQASILH